MKIIKIFLLLLGFLFSSCLAGELLSRGDYYFLRRAGADMPVWVKGNARSNTFILLLHGGPGAPPTST